jgi:hypothetical protein
MISFVTFWAENAEFGMAAEQRDPSDQRLLERVLPMTYLLRLIDQTVEP